MPPAAGSLSFFLVILQLTHTLADRQHQPTSNFLDFTDNLAVESVVKPTVVSSDFNEFENIFENLDSFSWDKLSGLGLSSEDDVEYLVDQADAGGDESLLQHLLVNGVDNVENELTDLLFNDTLVSKY